MSENNNETYRYYVPVRFCEGEKAFTFGCNKPSYKKDDVVVVETIRGLELGTVVANPKESDNSLSTVVKPIIRLATSADLKTHENNLKDKPAMMEKCRQAIADLNLPMNLTNAEYTLDRSRIVFTYVSEQRVDFRELLHNLAGLFHTRIELRQIGPRDKAKVVGGIGLCGMPLCCARFRKDFGVISINMAKNQFLALNPQKLSGQCGKLMCCLAFENDAYKELRKGLPKMNSTITYEGKHYKVVSINVLNNNARLANNDGYVELSLDQLRGIVPSNTKATPSPSEK